MNPAVTFALAAMAVIGLAALHPRAPGPGRPPRQATASVHPRRPSAAPGWLVRVIDDAGVVADPGALWSLGRPVALLVAGAVWLVLGPAVTVILATVLAATPRLLRGALRGHRLRRRDAQLPAALERLASALRAGHAAGPAFVEVAASTPEPLGSEVRAVAAEVRHGAPLADALDRWALHPDASPPLVLATSALTLGVATGGEIARSVDRVAATLRERQELQAEVRGLAAQARASAAVLALAPIAFTLLVASVEPALGTFLVATPVGLACLAGGLVLEAMGALWMARIMARAA